MFASDEPNYITFFYENAQGTTMGDLRKIISEKVQAKPPSHQQSLLYDVTIFVVLRSLDPLSRFDHKTHGRTANKQLIRRIPRWTC